MHAEKEILCRNVMFRRELRSYVIAFCECFFATLFTLLSLVSYFYTKQLICCYFFLVNAFLYLSLFWLYFFGLRYNCRSSLRCHTIQSGMLAVAIFIFTTIFLVYYTPYSAVAAWFRVSTTCFAVVSVCSCVLLLTFSASSYSREKQIECLETSQIDHVHRLMIHIREQAQSLLSRREPRHNANPWTVANMK